MLRPWKLEIQLSDKAGKAVYLQIADAIVADIQSGRLKGGTALPGSRTMARDLQVNRNTIVEALNVLLNEEWLVTRERKGTFVADVFPVIKKSRPASVSPAPAPAPHYRISFDDGHPDSKIAPIAELARAYRQIFQRKAKWQLMGYGSELGDAGFRQAIVQMLNQKRGMQVNEQQLCITRGSQMAMFLTAQCLLEKDSCVMVENPGYQPAWKAFRHAGAKVLPVRVDAEGLVIADVEAHLRSGQHIKALYTTPHHQYPTTVTLSLQRRLELIRLSNQHGFTIIEDDYDNEFHFGYRPVLPLSSYGELKRFAYIGTMSKVVAPALRIGYLASNVPGLMEKVSELRKIIDVQGDAIMEQAVLQLISDGTIKRHLKKATQYYQSKCANAVALLHKHLRHKASFTPPDGGLAIWIVPAKAPDWRKVSEKLQAQGIRVITPDAYSCGKTINGLRLSYGAVSEEQLEEGIKALAALL
ncbi:PLP-dependent aminotransferase family protein [Chitinophaga sp.]|uniref:MocR-like pyridoxine biosynthesis transcription factor PdxR n=1 Tax=Chitinophaga sp. TaxID=1869181 RepID=UPI0026101849|nr:PLP-dependent aminotransferase family protein [uncultured Chitinophaga sp.]